MTSRAVGSALLLASLLVTACAPTGEPPVPTVLAPFAGKHVAVTLGFTRCPDVCPTELWHWRQALRSLTPRKRAGLRLAFVTVDPERDTPDALERYLAHFDPAFAGVRVTGDELKELLRFLHAHARKVPSRTPGEYTVDHTAGTVLLDPSGRRIDEFRHGTATAEIAARLRAVLAKKPIDRPAAEPIADVR